MQELQFEKALHNLINTRIGLFLSDQQFMQGNLLAVQQDHLVLVVNENVHYVPLNHIKALSNNTNESHSTLQIVPFLDRQYFTELLDVFKNSWCTINGPVKKAYVGEINKVAEDYLMLLTHAESLYIATSWITNIHSEIPQHQILLANQNKPVTMQDMQPTPVVAEDIETQLPVVSNDAVIQMADEPKSIEIPLEKEPLQSEVIRELQIVGHVKQDQLETLESQGLFNEEEVEKSSSQEETKEVPSIILEETPDIQDEEFLVDSQEIPVVQEEYLVEVLELESMQIEEPLETESLESSFLEHDVPEAVVVDKDEAHSSEFDDWGVLESVFGTRKATVEMLSFSDPLGFERNFPLSSWATVQKEKETASTRNKETEKKEISMRDDNSIQLQDTPKPIGELNSRAREQHSTKETETADHAEFLAEEARPASKTQSSITIITMSRQDEKAMLEEQYFSLAKQAANYSQKLAEHSDGSASTVQPSPSDNKMEKRKNPIDGSPKRNVGIDGQYISLMNHAAKMYQQFLDN